MPRSKQFDEKTVLRKALMLFWRKGFHATSMQDLVDGMGISRASMYSSFTGGKEEIFERSFLMYQEENRIRIKGVFENSHSIKQGFYTLLEGSVIEDVQAEKVKGCLLINSATELIPDDEKVHAMIQHNTELTKEIFEHYLQQGINTGEISAEKNAKELASYFFTLYGGLKVMAKIKADEGQLMASVQHGMQVLD